MTFLYDPKTSSTGQYEPIIHAAGHYEIITVHYELKKKRGIYTGPLWTQSEWRSFLTISNFYYVTPNN